MIALKIGSRIRVKKHSFHVGGIECIQESFIGSIAQNNGFNEYISDTVYVIRRDKGGSYAIAARYLEEIKNNNGGH